MSSDVKRRLVEAFARLFLEIGPPETDEEIDATLRSAGYDPDALSDDTMAMVKRELEAQAARQAEKEERACRLDYGQ